eukprot:COSAG06_NODE_245_length_19176_cov_167.625151_17_plen_93_part_00
MDYSVAAGLARAGTSSVRALRVTARGLVKTVEKTMLLRSAALLAAAAVAEGKATTSKPHIITLVIDDLGQSAQAHSVQRERSCSVPLQSAAL